MTLRVEILGEISLAPKGTFAPEFEEALDKLAINSVSEPVKTQFGYHSD